MGSTSGSKLPLKFYRRSTVRVAQSLLGQILCRQIPGGPLLKARIVETEAYLGVTDRACHTYGGRRTARTEMMWQDGGRAYVYLIYGLHFCLNAVTRSAKHPEAVLIRAAEPLEGIEYWTNQLPHLKPHEWLKGPGRICKAMQIGKSQNGIFLDGSDLWIERGTLLRSTFRAESPRIGVDYAKEAAGWALRFFDRNSKSVSGSMKESAKSRLKLPTRKTRLKKPSSSRSRS